jgi:spermidine/putrescine transport system ATP-binding protein
VTVGVERSGGLLDRGESAAVELERVTKRFGDLVAVDDLSVTVAENRFFALLGPSGCGKTTTLRMIGGFEELSEGTIRLHGEDVTGSKPYKRPVNTVFQSYALFPHLSVYENVAFGLRRQKVEQSAVKRQVMEMLELVQLTGREAARPRMLSGGQQQRVALARALINHPRVLLLDEPLGALDLKLRKEMQIELKRIQQEVGITFIHVTHDQEEALTMADTIAVMHNGRIERMGAPAEIYDDPRTGFVASFLGASNMMTADVIDASRGTIALVESGIHLRVAPGSIEPGESRLRIGVRPEKLHLAAIDEQPPGENSVEGVVTDASFIGVSTHYLIRSERVGQITAMVQNLSSRRFAPGERVKVGWLPQHTFVVHDRPH